MNDNPITPKGLKELRKEITHLETVAREEIAERIKTAREWGDLKENSEYHDAKNDQGLLEAKIARLNERLRGAVAVKTSGTDGVVGFGSTVEVTNTASRKTVKYTLVGSTEADLSTGKLSSESPVARALLGAQAGETVTVRAPAGEQSFKVNSISASR